MSKFGFNDYKKILKRIYKILRKIVLLKKVIIVEYH